MLDTIEQKISELRERVEKQDQKFDIEEWDEYINSLQKRIKREKLKIELLENDGIKMLIELYKVENKQINKLLLSKRDMTESERHWAFEKRGWNNRLIAFFSAAKTNLEQINNVIEKDIEYVS